MDGGLPPRPEDMKADPRTSIPIPPLGSIAACVSPILVRDASACRRHPDLAPDLAPSAPRAVMRNATTPLAWLASGHRRRVFLSKPLAGQAMKMAAHQHRRH